MNKLNNKIEDKIINIKNRYQKLDELFIGKFKKKLILFDDIYCKLNEIEDILDNFEIKYENDLELDIDIEKRIIKNKEYKKLANEFSPYFIFYLLNKLYNI